MYDMRVFWVDTNRDWVGLYVNEKLKWQGHPGDIEPHTWFDLITTATAAGTVICLDLEAVLDDRFRFPETFDVELIGARNKLKVLEVLG